MPIPKVTATLVRENLIDYELPVSCPDDASVFVHSLRENDPFFMPEGKETFVVLHLDIRHRPISVEAVSIGGLSGTLVQPRGVFRSAIIANAAGIVLCHNHPSGNTRPSFDDVEVTRRLITVGEVIGIYVLDHVIVGDNTDDFTSLRTTDPLLFDDPTHRSSELTDG